MKIVIHDIQDQNLIVRKTTIQTKQKQLFQLQRKIYQASKECNNSLVHSLQKLLISLKSMRTLAQDILSSQKYYSWKTTKKSTILNNRRIDDIDEILIMWCLEAEWQTKIKKYYISRNSISSKIQWSSNLTLNSISLRNIDNKYLLDKLQSVKWINDKVKYYLKRNLFIQERWQGLFKYKNTIKYSLVNLLYSILLLGMEWTYYQQKLYNTEKKKVIFELLISDIYIFNQKTKHDTVSEITLENFLYNSGILRNCTINFSDNKNIQKNIDLTKFNQAELSVKELILSVKNAIYNKDYIGRHRISYNSSSLNDIYEILTYWSYYYKVLTSVIDANYLDYTVNNIINTWIRKSNTLVNYSVRNKIQSKLYAIELLDK